MRLKIFKADLIGEKELGNGKTVAQWKIQFSRVHHLVVDVWEGLQIVAGNEYYMTANTREYNGKLYNSIQLRELRDEN